MRGFKRPRLADLFCHAYDELRNFLDPALEPTARRSSRQREVEPPAGHCSSMNVSVFSVMNYLNIPNHLTSRAETNGISVELCSTRFATTRAGGH